ncbi:PHB depolymerase family esterase [Metabacillus sp. HB246100]
MYIGKQLWAMCLSVVLIFSLVVTVIPTETHAEGQFISGSYGGKAYKLYVPNQYDQSKEYPLYVMLHGCTQDAAQFAAGTKMNPLADEKGFLVLYPEQSSSANSNKCWNWFETSHQSRGSGEPSVIAGMVAKIKSSHSINDDQVFVSGLSAGAAMSVIMGATYPDVFSGVGVGAGLEYKAATSMINAFTAMSSGGPNPDQQGRTAYQQMGSRAKVMPVIVFHGTSDYTVNSVNGEQVVTQWSVTNDLAANGKEDGWIDDVPETTKNLQVSSGKSYTVSDYQGRDGKVWMKKVLVQGMGHAWSGGSTQGSYTDPQGPDASLMMWEFFNSFSSPSEEDTLAPTTTATPKGGSYTDSVSVELLVDEAATTYYTTDGSLPTTSSTIYTAPLTIAKTTTLSFFSVDAYGNSEQVKREEYMIDQNGDPSDPPTDSTLFSSVSTEDGFVGLYPADGKGAGDIKVGDKGMYNTDTYRGILSFDTSELSNQTIHSVTLKLYKKTVSGSVSSVQIEMKKGFYGNNSSIEQADYSSLSTQSNIGQFTIPQGEFIEIPLPSSAINKSGKTQFRLKPLTTAGFTANTIEFYGGEHAEFAPALIVN